MLAGAALRLYRLGGKSIWLDEAFSLAISLRDLTETLRLVVLTDTHPPLYYLLLNLWLAGGNGEGWARLLSLLFSVASIPVMYRLAAVLFDDERAGVAAAAILALSPFQVWYAQEVRMYAMLTFLVLVSAYFLILALKRSGVVHWLGYILATTLAIYTDNGALWYALAVGAFCAAFHRRLRHRLLPLALSFAAIGLLYAPWVPDLLGQARRVTEGFWLPAPSFRTVLSTLLDFNSFQLPWMAPSVVYMVAIFVFAYIVPEEGWRRPFLSLWFLAPLAVSLLVSLRQPIFLSRNLMAASLAYYLILAGTVAKFKGTRTAALLLAPLLAMNLISIAGNARRETKEDWRAAAAYVAAEAAARPGGLIVFVPSYAELPFEYYFARYNIRPQTRGFPADEILLHPEPRRVTNLAALLAARPYVWLVLRDWESADPDGTVKNWMDLHGYVRTGDMTGEDLAVLSYVRWDLVSVRRGPGKAGCRSGAVLGACPKKSHDDKTGPPATLHTHIVRKGETLASIAARYGASAEALAEANHLTHPAHVRPGQRLVVP